MLSLYGFPPPRLYVSPNCGKYINLVLFFHCSIVSYKLSDILGVNVLCFPQGQIETISQYDTSLVPRLAAYIPRSYNIKSTSDLDIINPL